MQQRQLMCPIIVNEKYQIIDGQHRFEVCKELGLPVFYIIKKGYGLDEVQMLNTNTKNWTLEAFADSYIELGNEEYNLYKKFREQYGFGHSESVAMLENATSRGHDEDGFRKGEFKVCDYRQAIQSAEKINMLSGIYKGYKRRSFVFAMLKCFSKKQYNHSTFISKLSYQSTKLVDCTTAEQYLTLIEEIYNVRNPNKINLRFQN